MSKMRNYEISLWKDELTDGEMQEVKMFVFGSDELNTQSRALEPKLKRKINGSNELTFKMYYQYIDDITGLKVENPYVKELINESKIKLKFKNKWYDLIIKDVSKNSSNYSVSYTATDLHINELSKNGFGLTLATELENNIGTAEELANSIFEDTDWIVDASEKIPQTLDESLVEITLAQELSLNVTRLVNSSSVAPSEQQIPNFLIHKDDKVYLFYSCCKEENPRLQFIYVPADKQITKDQDRIITNKDSQYYIDNTSYFSIPAGDRYGLKVPDMFNIDSLSISEEYRGKRFVYSVKTLYNAILKRYVTEYTDQNGEKVHCFVDTEYVTPNIIQNYISNNTFKSNSGWQGSYFITNTSTPELFYNQSLKWGAQISIDTTPNLLEDLMIGNIDENQKYVPFLQSSFPISDNTIGVLVNSSFYDSRPKATDFSKGKKFILFYKQLPLEYDVKPHFVVKVGEALYDIEKGCYNNFNHLFLTFDSTQAQVYSGTVNGVDGYSFIEATIPDLPTFTEKEFNKLKIQTFITLKHQLANSDLKFQDFQIFPCYESEDGFVLPVDSIEETQAIAKYSYFYPEIPENKNATSVEDMVIMQSDNEPSGLSVVYNAGAEKTGTLSVAKSNYFNACQKLCETFNCWANFEIEHDEEGYVLKKTVRFKNYIGKENLGGFRYGVNLKNVSRKDDSKKIVTKLLVTDNTNEFAQNGFCTIQRAGSNETGENYIYDFSYYMNMGLLDRSLFSKILYDTKNAQGPDLVLVKPEHAGISLPFDCQGYYTRLSLLNKELDRVSNAMLQFSIPQMKAQADLTTYEAGLIAANSELENNMNSFRQMAGFEYTQIVASELEGFSPIEIAAETERRRALVEKNSSIKGYLSKIVELLPTKTDFETKKFQAETLVQEYNTALAALQSEWDVYYEWKKTLNKIFFKNFYRYIQEGTWSDSNQIDDEKYYIDAQSVAYNSAMPQVTYTFNVVSLEALNDGFVFDLGDKTFIEDEEYFGYDENGDPYREEVVITEISYSLDEFDKDSISIKNYKNQFQDLFQTITASVQTVNYTSGAWDKAAAFTESTDQEKSKFLQGALSHIDTVLTNAGEQSVVWDKAGITITDKTKPNQQIRMIAGGIFLRDENDDGLNWKVGITSEGINAKLITAGQINTGLIQIMRGDEPYFRWDDHGITAYSFDESIKRITSNFNTKRGVRFDRFGVYGYDMNDESFVSETEIKDGQTWHPISIDEVRNNSIFSLTWDGLQLKPGAGYYGATGKIYHASYAFIGKTDGNLYNGWSDWYTPITNEVGDDQLPPFVKIISAGTKEGTSFTETLAIYDNGVLVCQDARLRGTIYAESGRIGSEEAGWKIDANSITTGTLGTNGFHMFASGNQEESVGVGEFEDRDDWRLFIGQSFGVDSDGRLYANEANISGIITALAGGNIGGWAIGERSLIAENERFFMYSIGESIIKQIGNSSTKNNWRLIIGDNFGVDSEGILHAANAIIDGQISVGDGATIAGWEVTKNSLTYGQTIGTTNSFWMISADSEDNPSCSIGDSGDKSDWRLVIGNSFGVNKDGILYATNANITGNVSIGEGAIIAGWTVGTNCLTYGELLDDNSIHLYNLFPDEEVTIAGHKDNSWRIAVGDNFGVTKGGNLYATGGQVGKWNITEKALVQEYLYILAEDEIDYYSQKTGLETECIFQSYDDSRNIPSWQGVGIYQGELFIKTPEDYNQNPVLLSFESRFNPGVQYRVIWNRDDDKLEVVRMGTHQFKELMEKMKPPVQPL